MLAECCFHFQTMHVQISINAIAVIQNFVVHYDMNMSATFGIDPSANISLRLETVKTKLFSCLV